MGALSLSLSQITCLTASAALTNRDNAICLVGFSMERKSQEPTLWQQSKPPLMTPASHVGVPIHVLAATFPLKLFANVAEKAEESKPSVWAPHPRGQPG